MNATIILTIVIIEAIESLTSFPQICLMVAFTFESM